MYMQQPPVTIDICQLDLAGFAQAQTAGIDQREAGTVPGHPDTLKDLLKLWRYHPPSEQHFDSNRELFPWLSYQFVLYGMRFETDISLIEHSLTRTALADRLFAENKQVKNKALETLPRHRELMGKVKEFGFQPI